jgi:D-alanyl-D-alanine carboxypeptidase
MSKPVRFGSAVSLVVLSSMIAGCAAPQNRAVTAGSIKADSDVALGVRAAAALSANDYATAVSLAERAAAKTPNDATIRALLGNAYFGAGRFASAESAFKDSLFVESNQPRVILKLVLVEIAQGKTADALNYLEAGKTVIDPSDYGLALALAGRPQDGVAVLDAAARASSADSQIRQNLALAYALSGDWTNARTIAAQDVPADQLDSRIHQWMQLVTPHRASDQVAALVGVTPAAIDPGQPVQLALRQADTRLAEATPASAPAPAASVTVTLPPARPAPVEVAQVAPVAPPPPPAFQEVPVEQPTVTIAQAAMASPEAPAAFAAMMTNFHPTAPIRKAAPVRHAAAPRPSPVRNGNSAAVVQLGAYGSPQRVAAAWNTAARRFGGLRGYTPMSARFDSPQGIVYRLSVKGFTSYGEASGLCLAVRRAGGNCFVRNFAGDAPVQIAMR